MADHAELAKEMVALEALSSQERLKLAKKRRQQQLKKFQEYDKKYDKHEKQANKRKTKASSAIIQTHTETVAKTKTNSYQHNRPPALKRHIQFDKGVKLLEAAARNDISEVRSLLEDDVSPDVANEDGLTALHQCCIDDSEEMVLVLLKHGANVNSRDSELWTPLHAASTCGHLKICQHLLERDADLLAVNADGNMPYDICEEEDTLEYIETQMADQGVTQELIDETRLSTEKKMLDDIKEFEREGYQVSAWVDRLGSTLLHIGAANGYYDVVSYLLTKRFDVNEADNDGWTPAMAAACWGQIPVLELLAKNGADLEVKTKDKKSLVDLVDDTEVKAQISEIKKEVKVNTERFKRDATDVRRRSSTNIRSSQSGTSSIYNSNTSLSDKNPFSSSVRRHSMREKHKLSLKEARDEASFRISISTEDVTPLTSPDGTNPPSPSSAATDENASEAPITNIDDIDMTVSDNNVTTVNVGGSQATVDSPAVDTDSNHKIASKPSATIQITPEEGDSPPPLQRLPGDGEETTPNVSQNEQERSPDIQLSTSESSPATNTNNHQPLMNGSGDVNKAKLTIDTLEAENINKTVNTGHSKPEAQPQVSNTHNNEGGEGGETPSRSRSILKPDPPLNKFSGDLGGVVIEDPNPKKGCCVIQ